MKEKLEEILRKDFSINQSYHIGIWHGDGGIYDWLKKLRSKGFLTNRLHRSIFKKYVIIRNLKLKAKLSVFDQYTAVDIDCVLYVPQDLAEKIVIFGGLP